MGKCIFLLVASVVCLLQPRLICGQDYASCLYYSNCTIGTNLGLIDLNYAARSDPYSSTDPATGDNYLWKSCEDFTLHGVTAGAIQEPKGGYSQDLGVHSTAFCFVMNGKITITMLSANGVRNSYITCVCGSGSVFQFENENPSLTYNFNFVSDTCCPNYAPSTSSSSMSAGTLMVIVFFAVLVVYVVFGTIFQVAVRKAQGRDRIPNASLWTAFPSLIRDGFIFTFTCGRRSGYGEV